MAQRHQPSKRPVELNLTSMMDVILLLIIFFLLVTNFTAQELPPLEPPNPEDSQAYAPQKRNRLIINVLPDESSPGRADTIRVGSLRDIAPDNFAELTSLLNFEQERNPEVEVDLRADHRIHYRHIQPIMDAVTGAGISRINLVAYLPETQ